MSFVGIRFQIKEPSVAVEFVAMVADGSSEVTLSLDPTTRQIGGVTAQEGHPRLAIFRLVEG